MRCAWAPSYGYDANLMITEDVFRPLMRAIVARLKQTGFKGIFLMTGHHPKTQPAVLREIAAEMSDEKCHIWGNCDPVLGGIYKGDHAGYGETSFMMHGRPELVKIERLKPKDNHGVSKGRRWKPAGVPIIGAGREGNDRVGCSENGPDRARMGVARMSQTPLAGSAADWKNLGNSLILQGRHQEAIAAWQQSLVLNPHDALVHANLGTALQELGWFDEAITEHQRALQLRPDLAAVYNNLGSVLHDLSRVDEAISSFHRSLSLQSNFAPAYSNLALALQDEMRLDEAIAAHEHSIQLDGDSPMAYSGLIHAIKYHQGSTPQSIFEQHLRFARRFAEPLRSKIRPHANPSDPDRPLRIGYVSPDFRRHSVAWFLEPILRHHDQVRYEVYCYATDPRRDDVTNRLQGCAREFRSVVHLDDEQAADLVRSDRIDILVDLAGHTGNKRLLVFAYKPAPVQITYLGHPCTSGLSTMDYRITDAFADPPGMTEAFHTEKLVRMPQTFLCYQPSPKAPPVASLPADSAGHITFGSFNTLAKLTPRCMAMWSRLLQSVAGSRLVLKALSLRSSEVVAIVTNAFAAQGIAPERLDLLAHKASHTDHMASYGQVDIGLDTFPYHGTTTTCEALYMGVPVVALAGDSHLSRVGVSLLNNVGLGELVAQTEERYIEIAAGLAGDMAKLRALRGGLRQRMAASPLLDAARFTSNLETAYRTMWRSWCSQQRQRT